MAAAQPEGTPGEKAAVPVGARAAAMEAAQVEAQAAGRCRLRCLVPRHCRCCRRTDFRCPRRKDLPAGRPRGCRFRCPQVAAAEVATAEEPAARVEAQAAVPAEAQAAVPAEARAAVQAGARAAKVEAQAVGPAGARAAAPEAVMVAARAVAPAAELAVGRRAAVPAAGDYRLRCPGPRHCHCCRRTGFRCPSRMDPLVGCRRGFRFRCPRPAGAKGVEAQAAAMPVGTAEGPAVVMAAVPVEAKAEVPVEAQAEVPVEAQAGRCRLRCPGRRHCRCCRRTGSRCRSRTGRPAARHRGRHCRCRFLDRTAGRCRYRDSARHCRCHYRFRNRRRPAEETVAGKAVAPEAATAVARVAAIPVAARVAAIPVAAAVDSLHPNCPGPRSCRCCRHTGCRCRRHTGLRVERHHAAHWHFPGRQCRLRRERGRCRGWSRGPLDDPGRRPDPDCQCCRHRRRPDPYRVHHPPQGCRHCRRCCQGRAGGRDCRRHRSVVRRRRPRCRRLRPAARRVPAGHCHAPACPEGHLKTRHCRRRCPVLPVTRSRRPRRTIQGWRNDHPRLPRRRPVRGCRRLRQAVLPHCHRRPRPAARWLGPQYLPHPYRRAPERPECRRQAPAHRPPTARHRRARRRSRPVLHWRRHRFAHFHRSGPLRAAGCFRSCPAAVAAAAGRRWCSLHRCCRCRLPAAGQAARCRRQRPGSPLGRCRLHCRRDLGGPPAAARSRRHRWRPVRRPDHLRYRLRCRRPCRSAAAHCSKRPRSARPSSIRYCSASR